MSGKFNSLFYLFPILILHSFELSAQIQPKVQITDVPRTVTFGNFEYLETDGWVADRYWGCEFEIPLQNDSLLWISPSFIVQDTVLANLIVSNPFFPDIVKEFERRYVINEKIRVFDSLFEKIK